MNEIIKELAIKAGFPEWSNHAIEFELEQFAELIVRECAEVVYSRSGHAQPQDLLEHFGVEE